MIKFFVYYEWLFGKRYKNVIWKKIIRMLIFSIMWLVVLDLFCILVIFFVIVFGVDVLGEGYFFWGYGG